MKVPQHQFSPTLAQLKRDDKIALKKFDSADAWFIADTIRNVFDLDGSSVVFCVRLFSGIELAGGVLGVVTPSNYDWMNGKYAVTQKYHQSSHLYGQALIAKHNDLPGYTLPEVEVAVIRAINTEPARSTEYLKALLCEDVDSVITLSELVNAYQIFMNFTGLKVMTSKQVQDLIVATFPSVLFDTASDGTSVIRNLRLKESHEKLKLSPTKVMEAHTENRFPQFAAHGGSFPINIAGVAGPIGG